ncbi:MAG: hypothetical protein OXF45_00470 [Candidatus Dadabacteria bacterium]|nr:hypothetical protein [Candidatus Dadabacteria bacterium]
MFLLVFLLSALAVGQPPVSASGWYAGIDSAFVSSKTEGTVGPIGVSITGQPQTIPVTVSYGGTDKLPGGSLFAGYSKTFARAFFIAGELNGGYGSYDDTKAFRNDVFTSRIDVTQGYFGATARAGLIIPGNLRVYSSIGWAHNWVEAEGTINSFSPPGVPGPPLSVNWPVKSDLTFDGITYGVGIEYGISSLLPLLKNAYLRLAYSRIEYAKEKFSYDASGFEDVMLPGGIGTLSIDSNTIPAEADAGVHVISLGLSYRFEI